MPQGTPTSYVIATKAPWWNRLNGGGNYSAAKVGGGAAYDNGFQRQMYDATGTNASNGNVTPAILYGDTNGRLALNNPNGTILSGQVTAPSAPTVTPTGGTATTQTYLLVGRTNSGSLTGAGATASTTVGPTTLSATAYNTLTGPIPALGIAYIDVYRTVGGASQGKIGSVNLSLLAGGTWTFVDTGLAGDSTTAPTLNTTGQLIVGNVSVGRQVVQFTLTTANILAMNGTPVSVLGSPGAGNVIAVNSSFIQFKPGATQFTGGGAITLVYHGGSVNPHSGNIPAATFTSASASNNLLAPISGTIQPPTNTGIDITNASGAFATGNGSAIVTVDFNVIGLG